MTRTAPAATPDEGKPAGPARAVSRRDRRLRQAFFAALALVYFTVFPYLQAINNPNENTRVYLTMALVDHGTFRLDPVVRRHGWTNDMARVPDPGGGQHYAAAKGPLVSLLGVPVYAAQRAALSLLGRRPPAEGAPAAEAASWLRTTTITLQLFAVHLPCFLFLVWLERRLRRWSADPALRLGAVAALGLGTNYLAYSFVFVSHALSAAAAFVALDTIGALRLAARGDPDRARPRSAALAGLLAGLPALLEYQNAVLSAVAFFYGLSLFRRPRALLAFAGGALLDAALLGVFQHASFGAPWRTGVHFMETASFRAIWAEGFFGFTAPRAEALKGLLFDGSYGLFTTSPWMLLGLVGLALAPPLTRGPALARRERRLQLAAFGLAAFGLVTLMASGAMWRGGWTIGPRYLGAVPGLLVAPALALLEAAARRTRREPLRAASCGLALASFARGGAVGLVVSTLPESIERPLPQILLPLLELRLVPHHAFELLGIAGSGGFWLAPLGAVLALGLVLFARPPRLPPLAARVAGALALAALMLWPALRLPAGKPDAGPDVRSFFYSVWEPAGRDRVAAARAASQGDPCAARSLAQLERRLGRVREAAAADRRAQECGR